MEPTIKDSPGFRLELGNWGVPDCQIRKFHVFPKSGHFIAVTGSGPRFHVHSGYIHAKMADLFAPIFYCLPHEYTDGFRAYPLCAERAERLFRDIIGDYAMVDTPEIYRDNPIVR